jgi:hypothetical protein
MNTTDFDILESTCDLKVPFPRADRINSLVKLDPEELAAGPGSLEMVGYIQTKTEADIEGSCFPKGISAGLTNEGRLALSRPRW